MVALYVRMIITGRLTLEDVPARWNADVKAELIKRGYLSEDE